MYLKVSVRSCILLVFAISWTPYINGFLLHAAGGPHDSHHNDCNHDTAYKALYQMRQHDSCVSSNHMFASLTAIHEEGCVEAAVSSFAATYNSYSSGQCTCPGHYNLVKYPDTNHLHQHYDHCRHKASYMNVYNQYFEHHGGPTVNPCSSHHSLWQDLHAVMQDDRECFVDLLNHLSVGFHNLQDQCSCHVGTVAQVSTQHNATCFKYPSYAELMTVANNGGCYSSNSVWHHLQTLSDICRDDIMHYMAGKYSGGTSNNCHCTSRRPQLDMHVHGLDHDCKDWAPGSTFKAISEQLFHQSYHGCIDQSYLWPRLVNIKDYEDTHTPLYCLKNMISCAADTFPRLHSDPCTCQAISTAPPSTTTSTTTTSTTTTTQTTITTNTRLPIATATSPGGKTIDLLTAAPSSVSSVPFAGYVCDKIDTVVDIASAAHVHDSHASKCNESENDESLVLSVCNVTSSNSWKKGINVRFLDHPRDS